MAVVAGDELFGRLQSSIALWARLLPRHPGALQPPWHREATTNRRTFEYHALLDREPMTVDPTPPNGRGNERQGLAGMLQTPLSATSTTDKLSPAHFTYDSR